jgi:Mg-chelatase subunit ChlD
VLNTPSLAAGACERNGSPKIAGAAIESPAKLRRHLTTAVKAPERVGTERRQTGGRIDMRNLAGIASGSETIFRRRVEEEGREAAVTLLMDISGSMKGQSIAAAKALALHMGDALKAAGVRFSIAAFTDIELLTPKPFAKAWASETQRAVAGLKAEGGTAMLPAMRDCVKALLAVPNVSRRILLTLTDGQDCYPAEANAALCSWAATKGVEIVGMGIFVPNLDRTFNGRAVSVRDLRALSTVGLGELVKALDAGAPRTA